MSYQVIDNTPFKYLTEIILLFLANYGLGGVYNPHPDPNGFHSHGFRVPNHKLADR